MGYPFGRKIRFSLGLAGLFVPQIAFRLLAKICIIHPRIPAATSAPDVASRRSFLIKKKPLRVKRLI